jgi:hypothetical protein
MGLSYKKDAVPSTLREGEFAVVDGVTYVGNSSNEPVLVSGIETAFIGVVTFNPSTSISISEIKNGIGTYTLSYTSGPDRYRIDFDDALYSDFSNISIRYGNTIANGLSFPNGLPIIHSSTKLRIEFTDPSNHAGTVIYGSPKVIYVYIDVIRS